MRGRFITFEGGEGTGKSTQVRLLGKRLQGVGLKVVTTREPGGSAGADVIRHVILSGAAKPLGSNAEAILFAAARSDHVRCTIEPALTAGKWVICDRFADSSRIYQGALGRVDTLVINALERVAVGDTKPDLTLILDLPPKIGLARASRRRGKGAADRFEAEALEFHAQLSAAYRELARRELERCVLIDASGKQESVADAIWSVVADRFRLASEPAQRAVAVS